MVKKTFGALLLAAGIIPPLLVVVGVGYMFLPLMWEAVKGPLAVFAIGGTCYLLVGVGWNLLHPWKPPEREGPQQLELPL